MIRGCDVIALLKRVNNVDPNGTARLNDRLRAKVDQNSVIRNIHSVNVRVREAEVAGKIDLINYRLSLLLPGFSQMFQDDPSTILDGILSLSLPLSFCLSFHSIGTMLPHWKCA